MIHYISRGACLIFCLTHWNLMFTQTPIAPKWTVSIGERQHTSRDEIATVLYDKHQNTIVVGFAERDSSFADIVIQKIDSAGQVRWNHRYSSNMALDYDRPMGAQLDEQDNIYVLGVVGNESDLIGGAGYLYKVSPAGTLLWQIPLHQNLPAHASLNALFWRFDAQEKIHLAYVTEPDKNAYLFKIASNGIIEENRLIPNLFNSGSDHLKNFSVTADGTKTFWIERFNDRTFEYRYTTQRITDNSNTNHPIPLPDSLVRLLVNSGLPIRHTDPMGHFYTFVNETTATSSRIQLFKFSNTGQIIYIMNTTDSIAIEGRAMIIKDTSCLLTGRYRQTPQNAWRSFVMELGARGQVLKKKFMTSNTVSDEVAESIHFSKNRVFLTSRLPNERLVITELDSNLSKIREFRQSSTQPILQNVSVGVVNARLVSFSGTVQNRKLPNNYFFSENDFYTASFAIGNLDTLQWKTQYSDLGTSLVQNLHFMVNSEQDVWITHDEQVGPTYPSAQTPVGSVRYKTLVNPAGQATPSEVLSSGFAGEYATNQTGHFIIGTGYQFKKIDKLGVILQQSPILWEPATLIYTDTLRQEYYAKSQNYIFRLNWQLQILSSRASFGQSHYFQLDGNIYCYETAYDGATGFKKFQLYASEQLRWRKDSLTTNQYVVWEVNSQTGSLYLLTGTNLMSVHLSGQVEIIQTSLRASDVISHLFCMPNGSFVLCGSSGIGQMVLGCSPTGEILQRRSISHEYNTTFLRIGVFVFRCSAGRQMIFGQTGEHLLTVTHPLLTRSPQYFDNNYNFWIGDIAGKAFFLQSGSGNEAYGWRWFRGNVSKFELGSLLKPHLRTGETTIQPAKTHPISVYPNPASGQLYLKINEAISQNTKLLIYNNLGQFVLSISTNALSNEGAFDIHSLNNGLYFLKMEGRDTPIAKFIVSNF